MSSKKPSILDWLWPHVELDFSKARPFGRIAGSVLILLLVVLAICVLGALASFILAVLHLGPYQGQANDAAIRNIGLVLAAAFGAPFIAWRSWVAQRQTDITEQGHITDRINKAVQGLGSEKTVRRHRTNQEGRLLYEDGPDGKVDFKKPIFDEITVPNLEVRLGSIYALERVANDSEEDREQIFEIFCAYVSNNFSAPDIYPHKPLERFGTDEIDPSIDDRFRGSSEGLGREWASKLRKPRQDVGAAISVIARCIERYGEQNGEGGTPSLVFTGANLQRANFYGSNLAGSTFEDCQLDGANFETANISEAKFINCSLIGASLNRADLSGAQFNRSRLECVNAASISRMIGCSFWDCDCSGITFSDADLSGAHFHVVARKAMFRVESMNRTIFSMCDIRDGVISAHSMYRASIHATWVPETGVQLMERVKGSGGSTLTRAAKKVRLFAHPNQPHIASSDVFQADFLGMVEVDQGDTELIDIDTLEPPPK